MRNGQVTRAECVCEAHSYPLGVLHRQSARFEAAHGRVRPDDPRQTDTLLQRDQERAMWQPGSTLSRI